jgi:general secretion pathway protein M
MPRLAHLRARLLQAAPLILLALAMAAGGLYVWGKHQSLQLHLTDLEARYARMSGLVQRRPDIQAIEAQTRQQLAIGAYAASKDATQAANDAQQRIRNLFTENRLEVISIQALPAKEQSGFDNIPITLRVEGDLVALQAALINLPNLSPKVLVNSLSIQTIGAVKPASVQRLGAQISFSVFRART